MFINSDFETNQTYSFIDVNRDDSSKSRKEILKDSLLVPFELIDQLSDAFSGLKNKIEVRFLFFYSLSFI